MSENSMPLGDLRRSSLGEIWNSSDLRLMRLNMIEGKPNRQCTKCYDLERQSFPSLRQRINRDFAHHHDTVEATRTDGTVEKFHMPYLDVRFSNLCNFKCRTCCLDLSSSWYQDSQLLSGKHDRPQVITPTQDPQVLWRQIEELIPSVEEIYFAGGEPLVMEEHYQILEALAQRGMFHVRLCYNTNFSRTSHAGRDVLELWNRFETVRVGASLDGMGKRGEYLRKGQEWRRVVENRERMAKECPKAEFHVTATVSAMNVLHLPDFHRDWLERGYIGPHGFFLNMLFDPEEYNIQILPARLKERVIEKYAEHIETVVKPFGLSAGEEERFRAVPQFIMAEDRSSCLAKFKERTAALDKIREECFGDVFPELAELMR